MAGTLEVLNFGGKTGAAITAELNVAVSTLRDSVRLWETDYDGIACHHEDKVYMLRDGGDSTVTPDIVAPGSDNWVLVGPANAIEIGNTPTGLTGGNRYDVDTTTPNVTVSVDGEDYTGVEHTVDPALLAVGDWFTVNQRNDAPVIITGAPVDGDSVAPILSVQNYGAKTTVRYTWKGLPIGLETSDVPIGASTASDGTASAGVTLAAYEAKVIELNAAIAAAEESADIAALQTSHDALVADNATDAELAASEAALQAATTLVAADTAQAQAEVDALELLVAENVTASQMNTAIAASETTLRAERDALLDALDPEKRIGTLSGYVTADSPLTSPAGEKGSYFVVVDAITVDGVAVAANTVIRLNADALGGTATDWDIDPIMTAMLAKEYGHGEPYDIANAAYYGLDAASPSWVMHDSKAWQIDLPATLAQKQETPSTAFGNKWTQILEDTVNRRYKTLVDLVADHPTNERGKYWVNGRDTETDGGQGYFVWNAAVLRASADGGMIIDPARALSNQEYDANSTLTTTGCYVRVSDVVKPEFYAGLDGVNDNVPLQAAYLMAFILQKKFIAENEYTTSAEIELKIDSGVFWDGSDPRKPIEARINKLITGHDGVGIRSSGGVIAGNVYIHQMTGPGADLAASVMTYPAAHSANEKIALLCTTGGHNIAIGTIEGFNYGVVTEGCWTCNIVVGQTLATGKAFHSRLDATGGKCQAVYYKHLGAGGVYTNTAFWNDDERRELSCDYGLDLHDITDSTFDVGVTQYISMTADSYSIKMAETVEHCHIGPVYLEGIRDQGHYIHCVGSYNTFDIKGPLYAPQLSTGTNGVYIGGNKNHVNGIPVINTAEATLATTTATGSSPIVITHGNYIDGVRVVNEPALKGVLTDLGQIPVPQYDATKVTRTVSNIDTPFSWRGSTQSVTYTIIDTSLGRAITNFFDITSETERVLKIEVMARNDEPAQNAEFTVYVEQTGGLKVGEGMTKTLKQGVGWELVQFEQIIPDGITELRLNMAMANGVTGGTTKITFTPPYASFEIDDINGQPLPTRYFNANGAVDEAAAIALLEVDRPAAKHRAGYSVVIENIGTAIDGKTIIVERKTAADDTTPAWVDNGSGIASVIASVDASVDALGAGRGAALTTAINATYPPASSTAGTDLTVINVGATPNGEVMFMKRGTAADNTTPAWVEIN